MFTPWFPAAARVSRAINGSPHCLRPKRTQRQPLPSGCDQSEEAFRKAALSRLRKLYAQEKLKLCGKFEYLRDEASWKALCDDLAKLDWVSFIQPPPTKTSTAEQVVRYLTRYLTGGPISDSRIVAADTSSVTFMAREGVRVGGQREQVPVEVETMEFMRRWCLHIQPEQLTKTRTSELVLP